MRWSPNISRYFSNLYSYGGQHCTATYLKDWRNAQQLKRDSPFSRAAKLNLLFPEVEPCSLGPFLNLLEDLPRVFFHEKLWSFSSKKDRRPVLLKQLALETIHNTPLGAVRIFTDGSKNDNGNTGSGVVIKTPDAITKIKKRNPNFCSVFRSELIAIDEALDHMISNNSSCDICIFTDSRSSIQFLSNWRNIGDKTGTDIVNKLRIYSSHNNIHLQWIPSHVDLFFNDLADELAKESSAELLDNRGLLTYSEIFSEVRADNNRAWRIPPIHDWYQQKHPGAALELKGDRKFQTTEARFISGHTRTLSYVQGQRLFLVCLKCNTHQSTQDHLFSRMELEKRNVFKSPALVRDFPWASGLLDLL
ncbi:hypothetical protein AVEN_270067-1 [Araneus ventricosus]|uniref:ribonuclease H n=1 Tax=Araneus ventricosus TaxID=182803 RepID=A0A4Y2MU58_ARAVE|nr:hypothetical protein AVEN_270067-1 [Araneus ventricosus]